MTARNPKNSPPDVAGSYARPIPVAWCACCSKPLSRDRPTRVLTHYEAAARLEYCAECGDPTAIEWHFAVVDARGETVRGLPDPIGTLTAHRSAWPRDVARAADDAARALAIVVDRQGERVALDLLCYSRAAAHAVGAQDEYDEDPDASITCRMVYYVDLTGAVVVDYVGRIA